MTDFQAKRIIRHYKERIAASPSQIFPLLCPVREYDWLEGWDCDMIYSESGFAENNNVFTTGFLGQGKEIWVVTRRSSMPL